MLICNPHYLRSVMSYRVLVSKIDTEIRAQ